jgi:hypothetical protein
VNIKPIYDNSHPKQLDASAQDQELTASASTGPDRQPEIPDDFTGSWSGDMTVSMVDFGSNMFNFDRAEAEQQQRLITQGRQGRCTVSFTKMGDRVEMQPTQIVFSAPISQAIQEMGQGNSTIAALGGLLGNNNPMLAGKTIPEFALPLGMMASNRGVTGNQLGSELMKNKLKQPGQGIIEEQIVTRDSDRNKSGQVKVTFAESDLRFRQMDSNRLYCEAAAVSYDEQGNYLNKVILKGYLDKGAPMADSGQNQIDIMGNPGGDGGLGGLGGMLGGQGGQGGDGGLGGLGGLLGGQGGGGQGGQGGLGALLGGQGGNGGLGKLIQGGGLQGLMGGQGGNGQGGGLGGLQGLFGGGNGGQQNGGGFNSPQQAPQNMMNEMNEVQKLLQE